MNVNDMIKLAVGVVVGVLMLSAILIPVIGEATTTEKTFTNNGYFRMTSYDDTYTEAITLTWSYTNPNVFVINDEEIEIDIDYPTSVVIGDSAILRVGLGSTGTVTNVGYFNSTNSYYAEVGSSASISMTFTSGSYSGTVGSRSVSGTYEYIYIPDADGDYIMKNASEAAYLNGDSEILAKGITDVKNNAGNYLPKGLEISGTVDNLTLTVWKGASDFTCSAPVAHYSEVDGFIDLYSLENITTTGTVTETVDNETVTTNTAITYSYFIVPYQVTAEKSIHADSQTIQILEVIPMLVTVGIIVGIVGVAFSRRE